MTDEQQERLARLHHKWFGLRQQLTPDELAEYYQLFSISQASRHYPSPNHGEGMTTERRERIRAAARELGAALSAVGDDFNVDARGVDITTMCDGRRRYTYNVSVEATAREVIE